MLWPPKLKAPRAATPGPGLSSRSRASYGLRLTYSATPLSAGTPQPSPCAANFRGGFQAVTTARDSMPGPKFIFTATGFPSFSSNSVGTNQDEIPGPVAMACQTSSGVPGTSTSTWMERRPEASFFTLMMSPWDWISAAEGALGGATPPTLLG